MSRPGTEENVRRRRAMACRLAAQQVEREAGDNQNGCCTALLGTVGLDLTHRFGDLFRPTFEEQDAYLGERRCIYWMGNPLNPTTQDARVLAICMFAAMVEAGDA